MIFESGKPIFPRIMPNLLGEPMENTLFGIVLRATVFFVNGDKVQESHIVKAGDTIRFGSMVCQVVEGQKDDTYGMGMGELLLRDSVSGSNSNVKKLERPGASTFEDDDTKPMVEGNNRSVHMTPGFNAGLLIGRRQSRNSEALQRIATAGGPSRAKQDQLGGYYREIYLY